MKQFRKTLAVLLSVLMLCTVLPLSALVSAADASYDGYFYNGDFEAGTSNWTMHNDTDTITEVVADPTNSGHGKVMHTNSTYTSSSSGCDLMFNQVVTLEANTDVVLKFKVYCYSTASNAAFWVTIGNNTATYSTSAVTGLAAQTVSSSSSTRVRLNVTSNTNKWVEVAIPYNTGSNTSVEFRFDNYRTGAGQYYFDDITIEGPNNVNGDDNEGGDEPEEPGDSDLTDAPADYNVLQNGDFELGEINWTKLVSTVGVVADPTGAGQGQVMQTNENGGSVHMFQQGVNLSANTDYILSYKVYTYAASGTNPGWWVTLGDTSATYSTSAVTSNGIEVKTVDSSSSTRVRFTITNSGLYNKWIEVTIPFNSGNNTAPNIMFSNYRGNAGQYYFDDVVLVRADGKMEPEPDQPEEPEEPELPDNPDAPVVAGNLVTNGNFETGDTSGWQKHQSSTVNTTAAMTGSYGAYLSGRGTYGSLLSTNVDVAIGKSYVVKMWLKVVDVGINIQVKETNNDGTQLAGKWCAANNFANWTQLSFVVSPTTNSLFINICGAGNGNYELAYIDDVVITEPPLISNGDFEAGDLSGWEKWQSTTISTNAAYEGSYGANLKGNGSWGGMLNQNLPVKSGKVYKLSFWYKINANGFTLQLKGVQSGTMYMNKQHKTPVGEWTQLTTTVTSNGDTAIVLNFSGVGGASADPSKAEDVYIDSITFTEMKSASDDGFIKNGDFETGSATPWITASGSDVSADAAHSGQYGLTLTGPGDWNGMAYQEFTTEVGKTYTVTMWLKAVANGTNAQVVDVASDKAVASTWFTTTSWTQKTFEFTATGTKTRINFCGGGNGIATTVYVDDIKVVRLQDPSFDGYIYNGDFEAGSLTKWNTTYGSTALTADANTGNYAASVKGPGDWGGGLLTQTITVEPGKTYTLSFWYMPISNGLNYKLRTADGATSFDTLYLDSRKVAQWTYHEVTFEPGYATEIELTFSGSGKGTTDEVLVDDFRLVNLSGNEMDRIQAVTPGGASIRDKDDAPALAFRFFLDADNVEAEKITHYVPGTGSLKLYKYAEVTGNLVRFGAVVTNKAAIGTDADAFKIDAANKQTVLDINAKYLMDHPDNTEKVEYAVRIINIPNNQVNTTIYARPYYIYELDGEEFTIYGDIVSDNYAAVESTRRTKRVLTIGGNYEDTDDYLYDVLKDADYDQIILGNVAGNTYYKNDNNGVWTTTTGVSKETAIAEERWQYIVVNDAEMLSWAEANKPADAKILYNIGWGDEYAADVAAAQTANVDGVIPTGTALENLGTINMAGLYDGANLTDKGDYAASLAWFVALTDESLDLVDEIPETIGADEYDISRAAAHAWYSPYAIDDLSEVVLLSGSDFQPDNWDKGITTLRGLTGSLQNQGYGMFDGLLFGGDYTQTLGSDFDSSNEGLYVLENEISKTVNFDRHYAQGNHDATGIDLLDPYGNNDPANAPYGVFLVHEDNYNAYGGGGQQVAADLTAYCNEKLANGWGNKPIFVVSHLPLHYNYRTMKDGGSKTASYIIDALNAASDAGLNIFFLISHNHSGGYDDYLGGAAIYIPKGDSILVPDASNVSNAPIETELKFTYMNCGYVSYYNDMGNGADTALTMCTFRIQQNGDVIVTRYDANGVHNLKSAGQLSPYDRDYTQYTQADGRVYESSRIVGAKKDEEYFG